MIPARVRFGTLVTESNSFHNLIHDPGNYRQHGRVDGRLEKKNRMVRICCILAHDCDLFLEPLLHHLAVSIGIPGHLSDRLLDFLICFFISDVSAFLLCFLALCRCSFLESVAKSSLGILVSSSRCSQRCRKYNG